MSAKTVKVRPTTVNLNFQVQYGYTTYRPWPHVTSPTWLTCPVSDHDLKLNDKKCKLLLLSRKRVPTCTQTVVVDSLPLEKSSPINILGSWYPPTCHGATMLLISAPGPRNTWACSTTTFIVILILRMLYTTSVGPLLEYSDLISKTWGALSHWCMLYTKPSTSIQ